MTGPQLQAMADAQARLAAAEHARLVVAVRTAVWAAPEQIEAYLRDTAGGDGSDRATWLAGLAEPDPEAEGGTGG